jgi:hypothetical protein
MGVEWKGNENFQELRNQESVPETENYDSSVKQECNQNIQLTLSDHENMKQILNSVNIYENLAEIFKKLNLTNKQSILLKSQM